MLRRARKAVVGGLAAGIALQLVTAIPAHAAVADWQKGASVVPTSPVDFASAAWKTSLRNLRATGANFVSLVVPYYQSSVRSTDIAPGWNTPTDAALISAIDFAHSIGLSVALKLHVDVYTGDWRAYINPPDRDGWYRAYGERLMHLARLAQVHDVEMLIIGTELVGMAAFSQNGDNTRRWLDLIGAVRSVYSGVLTYNANSNNNTSGGPFVDEKDYIGFWGHLDYAGLSVYYNLNSDDSVAGMQGAWEYWNSADLRGFAARTGKPLLFLEVGYRSIVDAHGEPWNWAVKGAPSEKEQANAYEALLSYWNNYDYIAGVHWWHWESNPNAGGSLSTGYTPQNKEAERVMTRWFSNPSPPTSVAEDRYSFTVTGTTTPASAASDVNLTLTVRNGGLPLVSGIVDLEVYDQDTLIFQKFFENVSLASGDKKDFSALWRARTPAGGGVYRVAVGIFSGDWQQTLYWNNGAAFLSP